MIRESVLGRTLSWFTAITWLLFATLCGLFGDHVTSKQWTYLMSVPGRKWFWCIAFGVGTLAAIVGLIRKRYVLTATGLFVVGTFCLLIAAFYLLAPVIDPGLMTLGYVPWFFAAALTFAFAAFNLTPLTWF